VTGMYLRTCDAGLFLYLACLRSSLGSLIVIAAANRQKSRNRTVLTGYI
jgi:hypothetical protein